MKKAKHIAGLTLSATILAVVMFGFILIAMAIGAMRLAFSVVDGFASKKSDGDQGVYYRRRRVGAS